MRYALEEEETACFFLQEITENDKRKDRLPLVRFTAFRCTFSNTGCEVYFIHFSPKIMLNIHVVHILRVVFQSNYGANMFNGFKHFAKGGAIS